VKITKLESLFVRPRWHFLKVHTDEGIVGLGEPIVEGRARTVATAVRELESYLIGQDPRHIERHWQTMYRGTFYRGGPVLLSAISGIEQALWDILGQSGPAQRQVPFLGRYSSPHVPSCRSLERLTFAPSIRYASFRQ